MDDVKIRGRMEQRQVNIQSSMGYTAAVGSMLADEVAMCVDKVSLHQSNLFLI